MQIFVESTVTSNHVEDAPVARFVIGVVTVKMVDDSLVLRPTV